MDKAMLYGKGSSDPLVTFTITAQEPQNSTDVDESAKKALGAGARRRAAKAAAKRSKPIKVGERG